MKISVTEQESVTILQFEGNLDTNTAPEAEESFQRAIADEFTERFVARVRHLRVGDPLDPATEVGPLAYAAHRDRVLGYMQLAREEGAEILAGGGPAPGFDRGYYVSPTLARVDSNALRICQEEVFGPVVSTESWDDEQDVIRIANDTVYGLAAGIWSTDVGRAMRIADRIEAGTVYINNYFNAASQSPVGGFKQSGYGRENGFEGMRCFMQTKSVWLSTNPNQPNPFPA